MEYNIAVYEDIYRDFRILFPEIAKQVVSHRIYSYFEIELTLQDGSKMIFDRITTTVRIIECDESGRMSKQTWLNEFGNRLAKVMCLKNKTQIDLVKETGISQSTISRYITGRSCPSILELRRISDALNCTISDLVDF